MIKNVILHITVTLSCCLFILLFGMVTPAQAQPVPPPPTYETGRRITQLGTWTSDTANNLQTAFITIDGAPVGPTTCRDNLLKINFNGAGDSGKFTKSLLILAFSSQMPVNLTVPSTTCVNGNPTFELISIDRPER